VALEIPLLVVDDGVLGRQALFVVWALSALTACGGSGAGPSAAGSVARAGSGVAHRALDDRPALMLIERLGDPSAGVAFAATLPGGLRASTATGAWLEARLIARGIASARARPHALGFGVTALAPNAVEAARFVDTLRTVLSEPVKAGDPALNAVKHALRALGARRAVGPAEAAVAACSAELAEPEAGPWDPASPGARAELAVLLEAAHGYENSAFAAVGPRDVTKAVEAALARGPAWPSGDELEDEWPERDELGVDFAATAARRLSLALRLGSPDSAVAAADTLGKPEATLARRLATLRPAWRVERVVAVSRPRGACLRVDVAPPDGDPGPTPGEVTRALAVVTEEAEIAGAEPARGQLEEAMLRPTDPAQAAAAAAWRALVGRESPSATRKFVSYLANAGERGRFDWAPALSAYREAAAKPGLELVSRTESGQAEVFALLASTCGTAAETDTDAGEAALVATILARTGERSDVAFEPWIATDGVGVLAHTARRGAAERPADQARRLARALGERIAASRPDVHDIAQARNTLLDAIGRDERRGYVLALEAVSGAHPSWLEPRGTYAALGSAPAGGFDAALDRLLSHPLRLVVLANGNTQQGEIVRSELERWLRPIRGEVMRCPSRARPTPPSAELSLTTVADSPEGSYLALPFSGFEASASPEARAALLLLNRPGGWLDQTLADLPGSASAKLLGGPGLGALIIQVVAAEGQQAAAVARVRALLDRLGMGGLPASEVNFARRELERADASARLDPRSRAVELFRGAKPAQPLDAVRLTRFYAALRSSGALTVTVTPRG
jgi:hypothetical protein